MVRIRTCIATRHRDDDRSLLRVVVDPHDASRRRILADPTRSMPGRGAWLTPTVEALELAEKHRAFARALRTSGPVDTSHVRMYLLSRSSNSDERGRT